jgi:YVTN family beta-propeller protein
VYASGGTVYAATGGAVSIATFSPAGAVSGSAKFTDPAGRTLTYTVPTTSTGGGGVSYNTATGAYTYTPTQAQRKAATATTIDSFTITASNGVNTATQTVTVAVDPGTLTVMATVGVGVLPVGVAVSPDGNRAYITNQGGSSVSVINTITNTVVDTIPVSGNPVGVAIGASRAFVISTLSTTSAVIDKVSVIDTDPTSAQYNKVVDTDEIAVGAGGTPTPVAVWASPDGRYCYVLNGFAEYGRETEFGYRPLVNTVKFLWPSYDYLSTAIDLTFENIPGSISSLPFPVGLARPEVGDYGGGTPGAWIITNSGNNTVSIVVERIGGQTTSQTTFAVGRGVSSAPRGVAVSPKGNSIYVALKGDNTVAVINGKTQTVTATIDVGSQPYGVAVSPDGTRLYVTNNDGNTMSVINTATNTVTATIDVGSSPQAVAVDPSGRYVYVTNTGDNTVSVIRTGL